MDKKILIAAVVGIVLVIVGVFALIGLASLGGDDFATHMQDAGDTNADAVVISSKLDKSLNDKSKKGIEGNINLTNELIPLYEKMEISFNKALNSTENETIKEYLKLAIKLNQLDLKETKNMQAIFKADQDYNNKKISLKEYNVKYDEYEKNHNIYVKESKKIVNKINDLIKDDTDFIEELKSFGFGGGLYLGEWLVL